MKASLLAWMFLAWTVLANMDRHYNMQAHLRRRTPTVDSGSGSGTDTNTDNEPTNLEPRASNLQARNVHINCLHVCTRGSAWFNGLACQDLCPEDRDKNDCDQHLRTKKTVRFLYHYFTSKKAHDILHGCEYFTASHSHFKECVQSFIDYHMADIRAFKHSGDCHHSSENNRPWIGPNSFVLSFKMGNTSELNQIKSQIYGRRAELRG